MRKIFLKKDIVTGTELSTDGVLAYVGLRSIYTLDSTVDYVSENRLAYTLVGEFDFPKALITSIHNGILELEEKGFISIRKNFGAKKSCEYILDMENLHIDTSKDFFVIVSDEEIKKLLTTDGDMSKKIRILKYFIALISTFDHSSKRDESVRGKVSHMGESYLASLADTCVKSVQRYTKFLEDAKLIYVHRSDDYINSNFVGLGVQQISNVYSRYEDAELCEEFATRFEEAVGDGHYKMRGKMRREESNKNKALAQIYNQIVSGNCNYSNEKIQEVYSYILKNNEENRKKIKFNSTHGYSIENIIIRDLSEFEKFDFLVSPSKTSTLDVEEVWGDMWD